MEIKGSASKCVLSGENWNNSSNAGVWNSNWNNYRTNSNNNVGFRCDCKSSNSNTRKWNYRDVSFLHYAKSIGSIFLVGFNSSKTRCAKHGELKLKRIGNLFEIAFTPENLYQAYLDARKGKRKKQACFNFEVSLGNNLAMLHEELHSGIYQPAPYRTFKVYEPKDRLIYAPTFRDIVVQHAIYRVIYSIFDRTFINTSFACRKGMSTHKACVYTQRALQSCSGDEYTLKLDIRKFFYSINRNILRKLIERKIKDKRFVDIMMAFAFIDAPDGIPIGNLLSQIYALLYMNPVDHFVKRVLKIKHYVRYVDDFILIGITRDQCLLFREKIIQFLKDGLVLRLSKSTIQKVKKGLNFVGYRTWKNKKFIRKFSLYKFKRMVKKSDQAAVASILGHAKYTNSLPYMLKILKEVKNDIKIPKNYRRLYNTYAY